VTSDCHPHLAGWWNDIRRHPSFETVFTAFPNPAQTTSLRAAQKEAANRVTFILAGD